ncbi:MAG: hypothetical protein ABJG78_19090 [Cyclobacteriaceae bacterium]
MSALMKLMVQQEEKAVHTNKSAKKRFDFSVLKNIHGSVLLVDRDRTVCILKWQGRVDKETASELLTLSAAAVKLDGHTKMLIDRRGLIEFDNEARIWIDSWIRTKAKSMFTGINKIAIINSDTPFGSIFNNSFNSTITTVFPQIEVRILVHGTKALEWLKSQT